MPRHARVAPGGFIHHVLNRAVARMKLFRVDADYLAFQRVMLEAHERVRIPILAYCLLPNHWHFVTMPRRDGQVTEFFRWLTHTHAMRWRVAHRSVGYGPLYQGRFKNFLVQRDEHLLTVLRYTERNALAAGLVRRAQDWRWCSLWTRAHGGSDVRSLLSDWPIPRPRDWPAYVNAPLTRREQQEVETSLKRQRPFGAERWIEQTVRRLHLEHTVRDEGRPRKDDRTPESQN